MSELGPDPAALPLIVVGLVVAGFLIGAVIAYFQIRRNRKK